MQGNLFAFIGSMLKKYRLPIITVFTVLFIDQCIKLYIKANYPIGEVCRIFGDWSRITFTENPGMAWGLEFGGDYGKLALSLFRIIAVFAGGFYIKKVCTFATIWNLSRQDTKSLKRTYFLWQNLHPSPRK